MPEYTLVDGFERKGNVGGVDIAIWNINDDVIYGLGYS